MISRDFYKNMCNCAEKCKMQNIVEKTYYYNNSKISFKYNKNVMNNDPLKGTS